MGRVANTIKNARYALACQFFGFIAAFVTRMVFVRVLGAEYLGIEGLFSNLITLLSVSELGVGAAVTYALYRPLAEGDCEKIKTLMRVFKIAYRAIGCSVLAVGMVLAVNVGLLVPDSAFEVGVVRRYFLIFVLNSGISYFFSYKRALIIADQRRYIATIYRYGFYVAMCLAQIALLLVAGSYVLYLAVMLLATTAENIFVSRKADSLYPYLRERDVARLEKSDRAELEKSIAALVCHKVGGVALSGVDSVMISAIVGVVGAGFYSNYCLVGNGLNTVYGVIIDSLSASIGHFGVTEDKARRMDLFRTLDLAVFGVYGATAFAIALCANPFVALWVGEEYVLDALFVGLFALNFYLQGMRRSVWVCKDAFGLFWPDRLRPIIEVPVKILLSVALIETVGISGAVAGTVVTTLIVNVGWESSVLFRRGLGISVSSYFCAYVPRFVAACLFVFFGLFLSSTFGPVLSLLLVLPLSLAVGFLLVFVPYGRTKEFRRVGDVVGRFVRVGTGR